jgi:glutaredoxin 3
MNIVVYTKPGCPWCKGVIGFLNEKGIAYEEKEVKSNKAFFNEMVQLSGQNKTPTLVIDGFILADSDKEQVEEYLKEKGEI